MNLQMMKVGELKRLLDAGEPVQLIDVRSPREFAIARVPDAQNVPLPNVPRHIRNLSALTPVVLICHSGGRACMAYDILKNHLQDVFVLDGGTLGWQQAGFPVLTGI